MAPIKVGLMGYGSSVKIFHLPFILPNPDFEVVAFLMRREAPKDKANAELGSHCTVDYPNAKHHRTADEFFGDKDIELVIVCTQHDTHFEFGKRALEAGKHVVVEKPFVPTSKEADELIAIQKKTNKILTVYQNRRYDSDFRTLEHLMSLKPNPFGKVTEFINIYDIDRPPWAMNKTNKEGKPGDGLMFGLGSHSLDQTLLLFGRPKSVTAFTRVLRMEDPGPTTADDSFTIVLQYDGEQKDMIVEVKTTVISPMAKQIKFWIRGTKGSFFKEGEDVQVEHLMEKGMKASDPGFGEEPSRFHGRLHTTVAVDGISTSQPSDPPGQEGDSTGVIFSGTIPSKVGSYMDYYRDVVAAIRGEKDVVVKPEQSRDGIRLIELAKESAKTGKTVEWS